MRVARFDYPINPNQNEFITDVEELANQTFPLPEGKPQILGVTDNVVIAANLGKLLRNKNIILACLEDEERRLAGFSLAMPLGMFDPQRTLLEGVNEKSNIKSAYVYYTALKENLRGKGIVGDLKAILHHRLIEQNYKLMIGDLVISNGYADNALEAYGPSVLFSKEHEGYEGTGPEKRIVVDLRNPTKLPGFAPGPDPNPYLDHRKK